VVTNDTSLNSKLSVKDDVSFNSKLFVSADASLNAKLSVQGDVSFNNKLFVNKDSSFNSNVDISGNLIIKGNLSVVQQLGTIINTTVNNYQILSTKDISLNGNLVVSADVSFNSNLFVETDLSVTGNITAGNALVLPIVQSDTAVNGSVRYNTSTSEFEGYSSNAWISLVGVISANKEVEITASDTSGLQFFTSASTTTEVMRIDNSGNVGIGITNTEPGTRYPSAALTISRPVANPAGDSAAATNFAPTELLRLQVTDADGGTGSINQGIGNGVKLSFCGGTDVTYQYEMATISSIKLINDDNNTASGLVFCTHRPELFNAPEPNSAIQTATERMRIDQNGNVGIGKSNPTATLDVSGNASISGILSLIDLSSTRINNTYLFRKNNSLILTCSGDNVPYYTSNFDPKESVYIGFNAGAAMNNMGSNNSEENGYNYYNTFIGYLAGCKNVRLKNTFIGSHAGLKCDFGYNNTYVGEWSGATTTSGYNNTLLGTGAGWNITSGHDNTCIGRAADFQNATQYNFSTAIGYNAKITRDCQVVLGDLANPAVWTYTYNMQATNIMEATTMNATNMNATNMNATNMNVTTPITSSIAPAVTINMDTAGSATYRQWQHSSQLEIRNTTNSNTLALAMSLDGVGIIQGKRVNVGYNNVVLNPIAGNVGIGTISPAYPLDICGNSGTLLRLQNNIPVYQDGQANIEFWTATNHCPLGMIKTTDTSNKPNGSFFSKMEFVINKETDTIAKFYSQTPALKLDSTGAEAASYNATSDYRIKENVLSLPDCSFVVDPLRPVYYRNKLTNKQDIGLLAHEVQEHFPFLVNGEKDGEHNQSVNYTGFIGLLIHEIQQLKRRVSELEKINRSPN
jgi:hypothetical protein